MRLFGIETEYGITREDLDVVDPVEESMALVRAHLEGDFSAVGTMAVRIRTRMPGDFGSRGCSRTRKRMSSPRSTRIGPFRFTK